MFALSLGTGVGHQVLRRIRAAIYPPPPVTIPPAMLAAPRLTGLGETGERGLAEIARPVVVDPGTWAGSPPPALGFAWARGGEPIAGAVGPSYVPGPEDDRAELACTVSAMNSAGVASAATSPLVVRHAPPTLVAPLPDIVHSLNSGDHALNISSAFTGAALTFGANGEGVTIDPATGELSIATDSLREGVEITVTATNSGGQISGAFRLSIVAVDVAPALIVAPSLGGAAVIGGVVTADPGIWSGTPLPELALQWLADGVAIAGATGSSYAPGPGDDGKTLAVQVTASNAAGRADATSAAMPVTYAAPLAVGTLADCVFELGSGAQTVAAAAAFTGASLSFAVTGEGATIDPANGIVTLSTDAVRDAAPVTVTASNSGGSARVSFAVTVAAVTAAPALVSQPELLGSALIGESVTLDPGVWSGKPAPDLAFQWRRNGADLPGATGAIYVPAPADDKAALTCRVTAKNPSGSAEAETEALPVTCAAPVVTPGFAGLADCRFELGSGPKIVAAAPAFTGAGLSFAVTGAGATIDPATGVVKLPTNLVRDAAPVTVTATNSGGSAKVGFAVTVAAAAVVPPALVSAPTLAGQARIGSEVTVAPGTWSGAPSFVFQWRRGATDIAGATGTAYVPVAADDRTSLSCRVTAINAGGSAVAETAALAVTYPAPVAAATLADVTVKQGSGVQTVAAAAAFTGAGLSFAVTGAGATIDAATGVVSIPTDTVRAAAKVTVTATNSGGSAQVGFAVTVAAVPAFPAQIAATLWTAVEERDSTAASGVAGRRRLTLNNSIAVPAGFELDWYSGPVAGGDASLGRDVTGDVGKSILTSSAMQVGATCHNALYWVRDDGAVQKASPDKAAFVIQGLLGPSGNVTTVSNSSQLMSALVNAKGGDIIECAPGTYSKLTRTAALTKSPAVTIRPQDRKNPPVWNDEAIEFSGVSGVIFDGLRFVGTRVESTKDGVKYPAPGAPAVSVRNFNDITFRNCTWKFLFRMLEIFPGSNALITCCHFTQVGMDSIRVFDKVTGIEISHCLFDDPRIDVERQHEENRHADYIQFAVPSDAQTGAVNVLIEDNKFISSQNTGKPIFFGNARHPSLSQLSSFGFKSVTIRGNYSETGRTHGIYVSGSMNTTIAGNVLRAWNNAYETPKISINDTHSGLVIKNNVMPTGTYWGQVPSGSAVSNNIASASAWPPGWMMPAVGPYAV